MPPKEQSAKSKEQSTSDVAGHARQAVFVGLDTTRIALKCPKSSKIVDQKTNVGRCTIA
jgi:hypothetical protein